MRSIQPIKQRGELCLFQRVELGKWSQMWVTKGQNPSANKLLPAKESELHPIEPRDRVK